LNKQIQDLYKDNEKKQTAIDTGAKINVLKTKNKIEQNNQDIKRLEKKYEQAKAIYDEHGTILTLGGIIYVFTKKECLSLFGGAYDEYMDFLSPYTTNWEMIKYAIDQGMTKYNFYGISGKIHDKNDEMYGLYDFKRGFGGQVEEYVGEFDLVVNKLMFFAYDKAFTAFMNYRLNRAKKK
ncbi:MAG: peptidoglycan bridge formation glycyltransferase FemA/FemB family protein, partial [Holdemanella sp.]|nr:peptidoglycan bridge formation glycyltransferase FemA/FemB family protein [Holdemanella sp.]